MYNDVHRLNGMSNGVLFLYSILAQTFPESPDVRMVSYVFI